MKLNVAYDDFADLLDRFAFEFGIDSHCPIVQAAEGLAEGRSEAKRFLSGESNEWMTCLEYVRRSLKGSDNVPKFGRRLLLWRLDGLEKTVAAEAVRRAKKRAA